MLLPAVPVWSGTDSNRVRPSGNTMKESGRFGALGFGDSELRLRVFGDAPGCHSSGDASVGAARPLPHVEPRQQRRRAAGQSPWPVWTCWGPGRSARGASPWRTPQGEHRSRGRQPQSRPPDSTRGCPPMSPGAAPASARVARQADASRGSASRGTFYMFGGAQYVHQERLRAPQTAPGACLARPGYLATCVSRPIVCCACCLPRLSGGLATH